MARMTRKQLLKDDEFTEQAKDLGQWLEENWQTAAKIAAVSFVGLLVLLAGISWMRGQDKRTRAKLAETMHAYRTEADAGFADPAKLEELVGRFGDLAGDSAPGRVARFYRGSLLERLGRTDEALAELEAVAQADEPTTVVASAQGLMTRIWIDTGREDEAVAYLQRLADGGETGYPVDQALLMLARVQQDRGKLSEARAALQRIVDEFPVSTASGEARQLLSEL